MGQPLLGGPFTDISVLVGLMGHGVSVAQLTGLIPLLIQRGALNPVLDPGKAIQQAERWYQFYLTVFRSGWAATRLPPLEMVTRQFFGGNSDEAAHSLSFFPKWIEEVLPKTRLDEVLDSAIADLADGRATDSELIGMFHQQPEPKRTILLAMWDHPDRVQRRKEIASR